MERAADVVVVGGGPGGLAAAVAAANAGRSVVVVEAAENIGGNALHSTGYLAMPGIPEQSALGIVDGPDQWLEDGLLEVERAREHYGMYFDEQLWSDYAANAPRVRDLLLRLGFELERLIPRPLQHRTPRMWALRDTAPFERGFRKELQRLGVDTLLSTRARRLCTDAGRVVGVQVESQGRSEHIAARRGVVLAAGGYGGNHAFRERFQPKYLATTGHPGIDTCVGDAHLMGAAIGADLLNMTAIPPLISISSGLAEVVIAVNGYGRRFHDECGPYLSRVEALRAQPEQLGYFICDDTAARSRARLLAHMPDVRTADDLATVARMIGCDEAELRATVDRWNAFLASGADRDPHTGRVVLPEGRRGIVTPPFRVMKMIIGVNFTCGGFKTDRRMAVLNVFDEPIPGLFAAGDCVASVNAAADLGGVHIMGALTLGLVAGASAAA